VDWLEYTPNDQAWEPTKNVVNAPQLLEEFDRTYPYKPGPCSHVATHGTRHRRREMVSL
jgi:hypothetical protein